MSRPTALLCAAAALLLLALCTLGVEASSAPQQQMRAAGMLRPRMRSLVDGLDDHTRPSVGHARDTNAGYLFLGALLALFVALAAIYMIVHKRPVIKPVLTERREVVELEQVHTEMPAPVPAPVVAAPVVVQSEPAAVMAATVPMAHPVDRSHEQLAHQDVHALRHNVMADQQAAVVYNEVEAKPTVDATSPDHEDDVHFVLHQ